MALVKELLWHFIATEDPTRAPEGDRCVLDSDDCFFSGRTSSDNPPGQGKQRDIMAIEPERRYGYQWGGSYGAKLLDYARRVGY